MMHQKPWSLWIGIVPGVIIGCVLFVLVAVSLNLRDETVSQISLPIWFLGGVLGALAIHVRNRAKGAIVHRSPRHWSPAKWALGGAAIGAVFYLLSWLSVFPFSPEETFNTFVLGLTFWAAIIASVRNLFIRRRS